MAERRNNERTLSTKYESLDYDLVENVVYLEHKHKSEFNKLLTRHLQRWLAIFLIALVTAMSGFFAGFTVKYLTTIKFYNIISLAEEHCPNTNRTSATDALSYAQIANCLVLPYLTWLAWNIVPSLIGSLMVTFIAPIAAGSGIPVVKCYLNGVKIPEVVHFKTYLSKLLGVVASVTGGLAVGKEGPFIQCGAAIGAGVSQGCSPTFGFRTPLFKSFRNDRDKRDFTSAGASAGVAAAFGAPIGGVLFALEEGSSFWNQALTWRIFFCSMMTSFILNLFMSAYNTTDGMLAFHSLVNFGLVEEVDYFWFEIPIYICIAIWGGFVGASFCYMNLVLSKIRKRFVTKKWQKLLEVVIVASLTATAGLLMIIFASECRKMPMDLTKTPEANPRIIQTPNRSGLDMYQLFRLDKFLFAHNSTQKISAVLTSSPEEKARDILKNHVFTFMCPPGEYSAMSSLWLKTSEGASSAFMVLEDDIWSIRTLALFLCVYYVLAVITYGMSISAGVFIPSLLIGATGGRLIGLVMRHFFGPLIWLDKLNKFAIIGAASTLGGVVRMTISLTVIIIEATGCISFGMPIMICLMISKWVADSFIDGLYDLSIHTSNVPFLGWEPPSRSHSIYASDVMSPNVKVLQTTETVANLISVLRSTSHNGFPVVDLDQEEDGSGYGVSRQARRDFGSSLISPMSSENTTTNGDYYTPEDSPIQTARGVRNLFLNQSPQNSNNNNNQSTSDTRTLIDEQQLADEQQQLPEEQLTGSFQRCAVTARRESYGRFRGLILRWQILTMIDLRMFNENERSFERLSLHSFQQKYPRYPQLEDVVANLSDEMYSYHIDLRSVMNPTCYTVLYSASYPRIYQLFRSLGLRHLVVTDDRNKVVGMVTRKDLARYVRRRAADGVLRFHELRYSE